MTVVAFDGVCFGDGPVTGVGRAFVHGLRAYAARGEHDCVLLLPEGVASEPIDGVRTIAAPRGRWRRQRRLPALLRDLGAALLHSSVASVPLGAPCPTIATVHDLPWLHPELDEPSSCWRRFATRRALRSAARVLAPSTMTMRDAQQLLGADGPPVELAPHGVPPPTSPPLREHQRTGPFLVLGDDRPRKNRVKVRAAHTLLTATGAGAPALRFVGPPNDYVSERDKHELLRTCRAVVHASRFEGFGLPALEALAHGAPLVCADLPPLREIAGDAAVYVDPDEPEAILDGLAAAHGDAALRARLVDAGPRRAALFRPERTAEHWLRVHREVIA
ncbi:MAG: glycosyltransferase family 4 protein [Planctomycetes bacterium]|nr:glycosyltransferase family 4 protein [Planctomycetota bacterium]